MPWLALLCAASEDYMQDEEYIDTNFSSIIIGELLAKGDKDIWNSIFCPLQDWYGSYGNIIEL